MGRSRKEAYNLDFFVSAQIRLRRIKLGIGQKELGDAVGVVPQQIHKYETGINRVPVGRLYQIAKALRCKPADLFPETPPAAEPRSAALLRDTASLSDEERRVVCDAARRLAALA